MIVTDAATTEASPQDLLFDKFSESCEGQEHATILMTCLDLIVACVSECEEDEFTKSAIMAMMTAAIFLRENVLTRKDEPIIQLLN